MLRNTIPQYRTLRRFAMPRTVATSKSTAALVHRVRQRETQLSRIGSAEFCRFATDFRARMKVSGDVTQSDLVVESFALTAEALHRVRSIRYYDVQLHAGFALAAGTVAEIQTGEGKTVTTALPAVLHAWSGRGVHIATTNCYLSGRDHSELAEVYQLLGLSSDRLRPQSSATEKQSAYACDLTYGPGFEFGFDFLRDQIARRVRARKPLGQQFSNRLRGIPDQDAMIMQRGLQFAIVDEADSVLIDEATTPLVLGGAVSEDSTDVAIIEYAADVAGRLQQDRDFAIDPIRAGIEWTESGVSAVERFATGVPTGGLGGRWLRIVENAIRARCLFHRDTHYVVRDRRVLIVDQNTGRIHAERKWSGGLHQAIECKEGIPLTEACDTDARITRQRYLGFYDKVAGMTGTALGSEGELREFYRLPVIPIPVHRPCLRRMLDLRTFASRKGKLRAIADESIQRSRNQQPVLIGTGSVEESESISNLLTGQSIRHTVLNGLQDAAEADVIARAGHAGMITVATNMAGRGTDIKPDCVAIDAGGLHVIGTQLHPCPRVDRQLAGRAARQGDPGSCRFYASADDPLVKFHAPELARDMRSDAGEEGECQSDFATRLSKAQDAATRNAVEARRQMIAHDDWIESVQASFAGTGSLAR